MADQSLKVQGRGAAARPARNEVHGMTILRRALPLDPATFPDIANGLTLAETGALVALALAWWPSGSFPVTDAALGRAMGCDPRSARRIFERLAPRFEPSASLGILRAAHIAKAERRRRAGAKGNAKRWECSSASDGHLAT